MDGPGVGHLRCGHEVYGFGFRTTVKCRTLRKNHDTVRTRHNQKGSRSKRGGESTLINFVWVHGVQGARQLEGGSVTIMQSPSSFGPVREGVEDCWELSVVGSVMHIVMTHTKLPGKCGETLLSNKDMR